MKKEIDGVVYKLIQSKNRLDNQCKGCVGHENDPLCLKLGSDCLRFGPGKEFTNFPIWVKDEEEPKNE